MTLRQRPKSVGAPLAQKVCASQRAAPKEKSVGANAPKRTYSVGAPLAPPLTLSAIAAATWATLSRPGLL